MLYISFVALNRLKLKSVTTLGVLQVDDAGNPKDDAVKQQIQQQFAEDWKQKLAEQVATKCIADWKADTAGERQIPPPPV
jgi:hypothetical protein